MRKPFILLVAQMTIKFQKQDNFLTEVNFFVYYRNYTNSLVPTQYETKSYRFVYKYFKMFIVRRCS